MLRVYETASWEIDVQGVRERRREWRGKRIQRRWSGGRREDIIYALNIIAQQGLTVNVQ